MRFRQQVHEISVPVPEGRIDGRQVDSLVDAFEVEYERIYGKNTALRISGVEFTVLRVEGTSPVIKPSARKVQSTGRSNQPSDQRQVYFFGQGFLPDPGLSQRSRRPGCTTGRSLHHRAAGYDHRGRAGAERRDGALRKHHFADWCAMNAQRLGIEQSSVYEYERQEVDPITFEVIRHRLLSITDEQAVTLASVSGSSLVNEATDFNTGLYRSFGEVVTMGKTVTFHAASLSLMVKHVIEDCEQSPGIHPGDMFIVNHPHKGALALSGCRRARSSSTKASASVGPAVARTSSTWAVWWRAHSRRWRRTFARKAC